MYMICKCNGVKHALTCCNFHVLLWRLLASQNLYIAFDTDQESSRGAMLVEIWRSQYDGDCNISVGGWEHEKMISYKEAARTKSLGTFSEH